MRPFSFSQPQPSKQRTKPPTKVRYWPSGVSRGSQEIDTLGSLSQHGVPSPRYGDNHTHTSSQEPPHSKHHHHHTHRQYHGYQATCASAFLPLPDDTNCSQMPGVCWEPWKYLLCSDTHIHSHAQNMRVANGLSHPCMLARPQPATAPCNHWECNQCAQFATRCPTTIRRQEQHHQYSLLVRGVLMLVCACANCTSQHSNPHSHTVNQARGVALQHACSLSLPTNTPLLCRPVSLDSNSM